MGDYEDFKRERTATDVIYATTIAAFTGVMVVIFWRYCLGWVLENWGFVPAALTFVGSIFCGGGFIIGMLRLYRILRGR